ncbi:MAG: type II CAAX endopeptidase family protein [Polyangiaceae bacterium]
MSSLAAVIWILGTTIVFVVFAMMLLPAGGLARAVGEGFVQLGVYLGAVLLLRRFYMRDLSLREAVGLRVPPIAMCLLAVVIGVSANVWIQVLFEFILERFPLPGTFDQAGMDESTPSNVLVVIRIAQLAVVIPLAEELLFRGGLMRPLLVKRTWIEPLVITSLLFCMVHYMRWQFAVPILPLALCLGGLRISSGSIIPSLLLHGSYNGASLCVLLFPQINRYITWPIFLGSIALSLLAALAAFVIGKRSTVAAQARAGDAD